MADIDKKLYYTYDSCGLLVLVPKKKGDGFLKIPYGHHANASLDDILNEANLFAKNLFGIDGYLYFEIYKPYSGNEKKVAEIVMPLLEKHYGFESEQVNYKKFCNIREGKYEQ